MKQRPLTVNTGIQVPGTPWATGRRHAPDVYVAFWLLAVTMWWLPAVSAGAPQETVPWSERILEVRHRAVDQVLDASHKPDGFLRANAIEAAHYLPKRVVPMVQLGLEDEHPAVRFAAAVTVGKLQLREMASAIERLTQDPSESVQAAALWALHLCGHTVDITPLAIMLTSPNPTTRGNAAMLLGLTKDPSTAAMLKDLAAAPMPRASAVQEAIVRIQIAEAIVQLGDDSALNALRAGAYSQFDEVRVLAVSILGRAKDHRMEKALAQMLANPPIELQIAAATSLAQLGRFDGESIPIHACRSPIPTVRAQAAMALAHFQSDQAAESLVDLLDDRQEQVRLSAAAAILRVVSNK